MVENRKFSKSSKRPKKSFLDHLWWCRTRWWPVFDDFLKKTIFFGLFKKWHFFPLKNHKKEHSAKVLENAGKWSENTCECLFMLFRTVAFIKKKKQIKKISFHFEDKSFWKSLYFSVFLKRIFQLSLNYGFFKVKNAHFQNALTSARNEIFRQLR